MVLYRGFSHGLFSLNKTLFPTFTMRKFHLRQGEDKSPLYVIECMHLRHVIVFRSNLECCVPRKNLQYYEYILNLHKKLI